MISPKLLDFLPFFFLIFSPLEAVDFLMLLKPSGDGYSLLCGKKQPTRHNRHLDLHTPVSTAKWTCKTLTKGKNYGDSFSYARLQLVMGKGEVSVGEGGRYRW